MNCTNTIPPAGYPSTGTPPDSYYNTRIQQDQDRNEIFERSRVRGDLCRDKDENHTCREHCDTMYRRGEDQRDCERLAVDQIEKLIVVYEILKDADGEGLRRIKAEGLDVFLNVSIAGFDDLVWDYGSNEAEEILIWIANNDEITEVFEDEDGDYRIFNQLLRKLRSIGSFEIEDAFTEDIDRRTLFEWAVSAGNDDAVAWFLEYIFNIDSSCNSDQQLSVACFTLICKIGDGFLEERYLRDWLAFRTFGDYIDEIISGGVNAGSTPKWDSSAITGVRDLVDKSPYRSQTWVVSLCGGLT